MDETGMDFLTLDGMSVTTLEAIARRAIVLAAQWDGRTMPRVLAGQRVGIITDLPGWRNPTALALGATEMGAVCVPVGAPLEGGEAIEDLAGYLDNWFDILAVRTPSLRKLQRLAGLLEAPVLNLRTNDNHPIEALGDLSFALARRGSWEGMRVAVVAPAGNILQSWIEAAAVLPICVTQISHPSFYATEPTEKLKQCADLAPLKEADLVVTDCWPKGASPAQQAHLAGLQITADVLADCRNDVMFIPCPPVMRGQEVSAEAMADPKCMSRAAKAFLLHVQNAVLETVRKG